MQEFEAIDKIFSRFTRGNFLSLGLKDDVALLPPSNKMQIFTTDALVENTHFLPDDDFFLLGKKLIAVNVSDILAKGAKPLYGFLNIVWPKNKDKEQLNQFANGILEALNDWGFPILGGDTTSTNNGLVISLSLIGEPFNNLPILRKNADAGDLLYVFNDIGRAFIGLKTRLGELDRALYPNCEKHFLCPNLVNIEGAQLIAKYAKASMDISDGLLGDSLKLCKDNIGLSLDIEKIPFCEEAVFWLKTQDNYIKSVLDLISFGDDYQPIIAISENIADEAEKAFYDNGLKIKKIGKFIEGEGICLQYLDQKIKIPEKISFVHGL